MNNISEKLKLFDYLPQGILAVDKNYNIVFWNKQLEILSNVSKLDRIGKNLFDIYPHLKINKYKIRIDSVLQEGTNAVFSAQLHKYIIPYEKEKIYFQNTTITPLLENNQILYAVFSIQDVTDEIKQILEYRKMRDIALVEIEERKKTEDALRRINLDKDKFFSIIAHDLKSPFISLLGFSEFLYKDIEIIEKDEIQEYSKYIYDAATKLFNLLENLLEWSRIQIGHIKYTPENFVINEIINERVELFKNNAKEKNINIELNLLEGLEVYADKYMIDTVFRNLLSNSLKYSKFNGKIKINAYKKDRECIVSIKDNGVGMDSEILNKLFKVEQIKSKKGTAEESGTGLGLLLCNEMIIKNNGNIWVESELDKGSEFFFSLPLRNENEQFYQ